MMERIITLLFIALISFGVHCVQDKMAIKQRISDKALDDVIHQFTAKNLSYTIEKYEEKFHGYNISEGRLMWEIRSLRGVKITGLYGNVDIIDSNNMSLNVGFTLFSLTANISLTGPDLNATAPNTTFIFYDSSLNLTFQLHTGKNKTSATLIHCKSKVGNFNAIGDLGKRIAALIKFDEKLLVGSMCPLVNKTLSKQLENILDIRESTPIRDGKNKKVDLRFYSNDMKANEHYVQNTYLLLNAANYTLNLSDVHFPDESLLKVRKSMDTWITRALIEHCANVTLLDDIKNGLVYNHTINKNKYRVDVSTTSWSSVMKMENEGFSLELRQVFHINYIKQGDYALSDCISLDVELDAVIPATKSISDWEMKFSPGIDGLLFYYTVFKFGGACSDLLPNETASMNAMQKDILLQYNKVFEQSLSGKAFKLEFPSDHFDYGFINPVAQLLQDALVITNDLRGGKITNRTHPPKVTVERNQLYRSKMVRFTYSTKDAETVIPVVGGASRGSPISWLTIVVAIAVYLHT